MLSKSYPHPEERPEGASRRTQNGNAALPHNSCPASALFPPYACWPRQLLPVRRRKAIYALYAFCREVEDIADGEASRSLRQTLLLNWRSEIARLFAGRPQDKRRCNRCSPA